MSTTFRIKRSPTSGNPSTLAQGELAYSYLTAAGGNGGDKLYIGTGTETSGNAANHQVIGGKYYVDLLDAATNLNTFSTIVKRDNSGNFTAGTITAALSGNATTASTWQTGRNLSLFGDASATLISVTGGIDVSAQLTLTTQGGVIIAQYVTSAASGTGSVATISFTGSYLFAVGSTVTISGVTPAGYNGTYTVTASTQGATSTVSYANTTTGSQTVAGAIVGAFGNSTNIPIITVNSKGLVTAITSTTISTTLALAGGFSTSGSVNLLGGTLTLSGGNGITTSVSGSTITIDSIGAGGYTTTVTAAGTTVLTSASSANQFFTGTTTQTVTLPSTAGLTVGQEFIVTNQSTGAVTVQTSTAAVVLAQIGGQSVTYTVASLADNTVTSWVYLYQGDTTITGTGSKVLSASPTITGHPTIEGITSTGATGTGKFVFDASPTIVSPSITTSIDSVTSTFSLLASPTAITFGALSNATTIGKSTGTVTLNGHVILEGVTSTGATGTGKIVFDTSPTLVTPTVSSGGASFTGATSGTTTVQATGVASGTLTLPAASDTLVGKATTDNFTNKTFNTAGTGNSFSINSNAITGVIGTGATVVLSVGPSLTGITTIATLNLTNQLAVIYGGTGTTTGSITGSGALSFTSGGSNTNVNLVPQGTGTVDVNSARITNVATPTSTTDAANKGYVDAIKQALDIKDSVRVATTANLTATASGTGTGKTLTNSGTQAALTIDSIVLVAGNRVLVKDQTFGANNGIYTVTTVGTASVNWVLTRAADADDSPTGEVTPGMFTFVEEGTVNADGGFVLTTDGAITIDTTTLTFVQFSGAGQIIPGYGISKSGNTLSIDTAITADLTTAQTLTNKTLSTGVIYNGGVIGSTYGGTGVNNGASTITIGGNVTMSGAYAFTGTLTGATLVTFPTTGTLVNTAVTTLSSLASIGTITTGVWNGTAIGTAYGGTNITSYATGDILYASASNVLSKLSIGTTGQVLQVSAGGIPTYADLDGGTY